MTTRWVPLAVMTLLFAIGAAQAAAPAEPDLGALAARAFASAEAGFAAGAGDSEAVYRWSVRWYQATRASDPQAAAAHARRMHTLADEVGKRVSTGMARTAEADAAAFFAAEADQWVRSPPP